MEHNERAESMIERYGEAVSFSQAGRIINRSPSTIRIMMADGRLDAACACARVGVYSIARYICAPAKIDGETRLRKHPRITVGRGLRYGRYHTLQRTPGWCPLKAADKDNAPGDAATSTESMSK